MAMVFAYTGAVLVSILAVPQIRRTVIGRDVEGLSALSWSLQALCAGTFLVYGFRTFSDPQVVGNVLPLLGAGLVAGTVIYIRKVLSPLQLAVAVVGILGYFSLMLYAVPPIMVGASAVFISLFCRWPQVFTSYKSLRAGTPTSVAKLTWIISIAAMTAWLSYGLLFPDWPVVIGCCISLSASILVLSFEVINSRRNNVVVRELQLAG